MKRVWRHSGLLGLVFALGLADITQAQPAASNRAHVAWALPADIGAADWSETIGQGGALEPVLFGRRKRRRAAICGDPDLQGEPVGAVSGHIQGCGATDAVRVRSVSGVALSQQSVMTCETAAALKDWVEKGVQPAFRKDVVGLRVAAHYACRTRNNRPGARLSEHGRAKAIDISGFILKGGEVVTVLDGWKSRKTRKRLEKAWRAACGPFGTVLGPRSDRYHLDHFHLDTARHRGGPYCR